MACTPATTSLPLTLFTLINRPPSPETPGPSDDAVQLSAEKLLAAVRRADSTSAPGPSGLRAANVISATADLHDASSSDLPAALAALTNTALRSEAPAGLTALWGNALLVLLAKNPERSAARPHGVGETLRRLAGRALMRNLRADAQAALLPRQGPVAVACGTEAIIHAASGAAEDPNDEGLFGVNAFNEVSRGEIPRQVRQQLPRLTPYVTLLYGGHSELFLSDTVVALPAGVQQGDALGPFLFFLALNSLLVDRQYHVPDLRHIHWYGDDGTLS